MNTYNLGNELLGRSHDRRTFICTTCVERRTATGIFPKHFRIRRSIESLSISSRLHYVRNRQHSFTFNTTYEFFQILWSRVSAYNGMSSSNYYCQSHPIVQCWLYASPEKGGFCLLYRWPDKLVQGSWQLLCRVCSLSRLLQYPRVE